MAKTPSPFSLNTRGAVSVGYVVGPCRPRKLNMKKNRRHKRRTDNPEGARLRPPGRGRFVLRKGKTRAVFERYDPPLDER